MNGQPIVRQVFGPRGSGKSTLARWIASREEKVLAFDPQGDYRGGQWINARTRAEVENAVIGQSGGVLRVSYTPDFDVADPVEEGVWLADTGRIIQRLYPAADPRALMLLYDEAHLAIPNKPLTALGGPLRRAVLQGRHDGIGLLIVTQRPSNVSTDARAQAAETFAFRMDLKNDRKAVEDIHGDAAPLMRGLKKYHFLRIDAEGVAVCTLAGEQGIVPATP